MSRARGLTDADLRALSLEERRELIKRLARLPGTRRRVHLDPRKLRRNRLALLTIGTVGLIPWTIYLGISLPDRYVVRNWTLTWTGFDVILTLMFAATALLALLRRQLVVLAAFTSGVLLLCDAWFDVTTASGTGDRLIAIGFAVLIELPVAVFLIRAALRLLRYTLRTVLLDPDMSLWRVRLLISDRPTP